MLSFVLSVMLHAIKVRLLILNGYRTPMAPLTDSMIFSESKP